MARPGSRRLLLAEHLALRDRLTEARRACGLKQTEANRLLGFGRNAVHAIERGDRLATYEELKAMAGLYRTPLEQLIGSCDAALICF